MGNKIYNNFFIFLSLFCVLIFAFCIFAIRTVSAASLSISPTGGFFTVDSTFDVSLFLETNGKSVNAVEIYLKFPPDKLQLVSPKISQSIVNIWASQPSLDNRTGVIKLEGVIPGGISASGGLIAKFTFRVKSVGSAILKFLDDSRVLLNDGLGTDVLEQVQNGIYHFVLPPPAGPIVISETHPDQSRWYSNSTIILKWSAESDVDGYSYVLNNEPVDFPDDISEGGKNFIIYKNIDNGIRYFHVKSSKNGAWGGTTHFSVSIDALPPAEFPVETSPSNRTANKQPIVRFITTDNFSGMDHYELKIVPLQTAKLQTESEENQQFFIEVESPHLLPVLDIGTYDVIVRAYDKTGNYRETVERINVINPFFKPITDKGLEIRGSFIVPWVWVWIIFAFLILLLGYVGWRLKKWHRAIHFKIFNKELPEHVKNQLEELKKYQSKYKGIAVFLLIVGTAYWTLFAAGVSAQETEFLKIELSPPVITTISKNISNDEIFYIGGKTELANSKIIVYLQNLQSGEALSQVVISDKKGDWFYRHNTFLSSGNYLLWTQSKIDEQMSPPSPQMQIKVQPTALQLGVSRISYEFIYLIIVVILLIIIGGIVFYIVFHSYHARKKHGIFIKEIEEAEESIRRGFAVLKRDIEAELAVIKKIKPNKSLSIEEKIKEKQLIEDIESVEKYIGKEIWDVKRAEHID